MTIHDYADYQALILKLAHSWKRRCNGNVEFEELVAEGQIAFCIADKEFKPDNGTKFSTYLYAVANNAMCDAASGNGRKMKFEFCDEKIEEVELPFSQTPEMQYRLKQWVEMLSKESQFLIGLVWETPAEIVQWAKEETYNPKNSQKHLTRYLRQMDWKWKNVRSCFHEIKNGLKEGV